MVSMSSYGILSGEDGRPHTHEWVLPNAVNKYHSRGSDSQARYLLYLSPLLRNIYTESGHDIRTRQELSRAINGCTIIYKHIIQRRRSERSLIDSFYAVYADSISLQSPFKETGNNEMVEFLPKGK